MKQLPADERLAFPQKSAMILAHCACSLYHDVLQSQFAEPHCPFCFANPASAQVPVVNLALWGISSYWQALPQLVDEAGNGSGATRFPPLSCGSVIHAAGIWQQPPLDSTQ